MSAYLVSKRHIDYLISAAIQYGCLRFENAAEMGGKLWNENQASVDGLYRNPASEPLPYDFSSFRDVAKVEPVQTLKAIDCYEYQSCEHDGWETSDARAFCRTLRAAATRALPGYEDAAWGID